MHEMRNELVGLPKADQVPTIDAKMEYVPPAMMRITGGDEADMGVGIAAVAVWAIGIGLGWAWT